MEQRPVLWITHPACRRHEMEPGHPESPARLAAIEDRLIAGGLDLFVTRVQAPEAPVEALIRVHDEELVEAVLRTRPDHLVRIDPDTSMGPHTAQAALRAAGACVLAVDQVIDGKAGFAFCAVRPPGHHAERARAMGFCFFNNVAVAAGHALSRGLARVAILDFDVHYGNGTSDIFRAEPRVLVCQSYQHPLYPFWEGIPGAAHIVDAPLPPGAGGAEFRDAVSRHWLPAVERFRPEMILVSAGFDAHANDPLANLRLVDEDYRWIGQQVQELARRHCKGRAMATLEGGYDLHSLATSVEAFMRPFVGA